MNERAIIVWFRQDLRVSDHPALAAAAERGGPVVPVYIWSEQDEGDWLAGAASRWWLHHSLEQLNEELTKLGSSLVIRRGRHEEELRRLIRETNASALVWTRRYEPAAVEHERRIQTTLQSDDFQVERFNGSLLHEPWEVLTKTEQPYRIFTPYWNACLELPEPAKPLPPPKQLKSFSKPLCSVPVEGLKLLPTIDWAEGIRKVWNPGEKHAKEGLRRFLKIAAHSYHTDRDRPDLLGTSRLSPHLHFGEISPRQIWHTVHEFSRHTNITKGAWSFLREVGWREFSYNLLYHFPHTADQPLIDYFAEFPWRDSRSDLTAWRQGKTGYPFIDAGMRELWHTGWMHNRTRMAVASFLVKDLLLSWQEGARWFWDTLVDADLANNTQGWQWTTGCGADAAPYFRVFNPVLQGEKFDPEGRYVKQWVPELKRLPKRWIHHPWDAPASVLADAGIQLGVNYPEPIVDHPQARDRALRLYRELKDRSQ